MSDCSDSRSVKNRLWALFREVEAISERNLPKTLNTSIFSTSLTRPNAFSQFRIAHFPSVARPAHIAVQRSTGGFIMSISEAERFDMQVGLRSHLGDHVANILMEHLPPSGWSDVARKQDFEPISYRIGNIEKELTRINSTLKVIIGGVLTVSAAIIVLLIQLNQNISSL
jgi:hypothetical protein